MKTLSVIIPTYNTSKEYFSKCLASLVCEQAGEIEIVVIDDGSMEQYSNEIKQEIEKSPLDIDYYKKKNGGQNSAREYGFAKVNAQYVFFMDADDYVDTAALDDVISLLRNNHPDILAFNYDVRTPDGRILEKHDRWKEKYDKVEVHKGLLYSDSLCLQIYKKDALCKSGIHLIQGVRIGEDMASATAILAAVGTEHATNASLPHYCKSILKNIFRIFTRFQKAHSKVYQTILIGSIKLTKSIFFSFNQTKYQRTFITRNFGCVHTVFLDFATKVSL